MKKIPQFAIFLAVSMAVLMISATPLYAIDFTISGQLNRAALYADDGDTAKWFYVDNINSSTRYRFRGSSDFDNNWRVGLLWEVEMKSNPSSSVSMNDDRDIPSTVSFNERHMDIWIEKWGILRLGQGDTATNGTAEVDLSGTAVAAYSSVSDVGGGFEFQKNGDKTTTPDGTVLRVGNTRSNFDGLSRKDRVRYDTPRWKGFFAAISAEGNNEWDVAARYAADFGWARMAAAAGWADFGTSADSEDGTRDWEFSSSASILLKSGLSFTTSYGFVDRDDKNPWNLFGKIGYQFLKKHAASIQYSRTKHLAGRNDKGDSFGLGYVFSPWQSIEFYGTYYLHMLELGRGSDPDDINIFMTGARVRF